MNKPLSMESQLTEDEVVLILIKYLESLGWQIDDYCLGHSRGYDIVASKDEKSLYVEAKGAKANDNSPIKKRSYFNSGQIKDHLGKAIVKSIETKIKFPKSIVAIAQPDNEYLKSVCRETAEYLSRIEIYCFWVNSEGKVSTNIKI